VSIRNIIAAATVACAATIAATACTAAAQRTFVATTGNDTNTAHNCSLAYPCRGFAAALAVTSSNGEIIVLDSGGYGPVTIDRSVSIFAPAGVYAGVSVFSGTGITVDGAGIHVALQGLAINGQGGTTGIAVLHAARVSIERVSIRNMTSNGLLITATGDFALRDVDVRSNGNVGVYIVPQTLPIAHVTIERLRSEHNSSSGMYIDNTVQLAVRDSLFGRNGQHGIYVYPDGPETIYFTIENCSIFHNELAGILVTGSGNVYAVLSGNTIEGHIAIGWAAVSLVGANFAGTIRTRQNNIFFGNAFDVAGTGAPLIPLNPL
jgi:hypothetical protein